MTPPSEPKQHPCRCETCGNTKGKDPKVCKVLDEVIYWAHMTSYIQGVVSRCGCASHSANTDAQARIDAVVKELERLEQLYYEDFKDRSDCPQKYESQGVALMCCRAIALLKEGVGK